MFASRSRRSPLLGSIDSIGRVVAETFANGIPVLASDRGALPETLGDAGFCFTIPAHCSPASAAVPSAREVAPWIAMIERLWDDHTFCEEHRERVRAESARWDAEELTERHHEFFSEIAGRA